MLRTITSLILALAFAGAFCFSCTVEDVEPDAAESGSSSSSDSGDQSVEPATDELVNELDPQASCGLSCTGGNPNQWRCCDASGNGCVHLSQAQCEAHYPNGAAMCKCVDNDIPITDGNWYTTGTEKSCEQIGIQCCGDKQCEPL